jgi:hypothetical protein
MCAFWLGLPGWMNAKAMSVSAAHASAPFPGIASS